MSIIKQPPFPRRKAGPDEKVLTLPDIQAAAYDTLLAFDAFCQRHGLRYYLCGGTLLGAVRHKGFIPWDDDVDLCMPRPEYDRMVALAMKEPIGECFQFACRENGLFLRPFSRVYHLKTDVQRKTHKPCSGAHVWIDILPVDGLPSDVPTLTKLFKLRVALDKCNFNAMWIVGSGHRDLDVLRHLSYYPLSRLVGAKGWSGILERMGRSRPYESCDTVGCFTAGRYGPGEAMPKAAFEKSAKVTFCGREFDTMSCYREYLTGIYGDYMTPPQESARRVHMDYVTMRRSDYEILRASHPERQDQ